MNPALRNWRFFRLENWSAKTYLIPVLGSSSECRPARKLCLSASHLCRGWCRRGCVMLRCSAWLFAQSQVSARRICLRGRRSRCHRSGLVRLLIWSAAKPRLAGSVGRLLSRPTRLACLRSCSQVSLSRSPEGRWSSSTVARSIRCLRWSSRHMGIGIRTRHC